MEMLSRYTHPISLSQLVQHLKTGSLPSKSVAVTFDDGYTDNLYQAKPMLEKYSVPATVFVCTGYVGKEFWWDEIERLVMSSQADLYALRLQVGDSQFQWEQPDGGSDAEKSEVRRRFRHALYHFLLPLDINDLKEAMDTIRGWAGSFTDEKSTPHSNFYNSQLEDWWSSVRTPGTIRCCHAFHWKDSKMKLFQAKRIWKTC